jgi:hypothetical protein
LIGKALSFMHIVLIPALVAAVAFLIYRVSMGDG